MNDSSMETARPIARAEKSQDVETLMMLETQKSPAPCAPERMENKALENREAR